MRLHVVTVVPGDTVERLASRMANVDRPLERFRVLNGLGPNDRLHPGDEVKVIGE
jgi:predicted Zn-dependent protease